MANTITAPVTIRRNTITAPATVRRNTINAPITLARDAYQLALADGFVGTRAEWLASLHGTSAPSYIHRSASNGAVNYIGKALAGSATSDAAWTITRIAVSSAGTVTTATASNVAWDDYLTATYS